MIDVTEINNWHVIASSILSTAVLKKWLAGYTKNKYRIKKFYYTNIKPPVDFCTILYLTQEKEVKFHRSFILLTKANLNRSLMK